MLTKLSDKELVRRLPEIYAEIKEDFEWANKHLDWEIEKATKRHSLVKLDELYRNVFITPKNKNKCSIIFDNERECEFYVTYFTTKNGLCFFFYCSDNLLAYFDEHFINRYVERCHLNIDQYDLMRRIRHEIDFYDVPRYEARDGYKNDEIRVISDDNVLLGYYAENNGIRLLRFTTAIPFECMSKTKGERIKDEDSEFLEKHKKEIKNIDFLRNYFVI